jgi:hypothetical protein
MLTYSLQLEFSLLALRDDPLPAMRTRLEALQGSAEDAELSDLMNKISNENSKRERWAVSIDFFVTSVTFLILFQSLRIACVVITTSALRMLYCWLWRRLESLIRRKQPLREG